MGQPRADDEQLIDLHHRIAGGAFMGAEHDAAKPAFAGREQTMKSYELFARYVMPHFQGSAVPLVESNRWIRDNRRQVLGNNVEAVRRAFTDTGRAVPDEYRYRTVGAQDIDPAGKG